MFLRILYAAIVIVALLVGYNFFATTYVIGQLKHAPMGQSIGPDDAPYVLVEFLDYRCGDCRIGYKAVDEFLGRHNDVRLAVAHFPLLGPDSVVAASFALAAAKQGKFAEAHKALMAREEPLKDEDVDDMAALLGLDAAQVKTDMMSDEVRDTLYRNTNAAQILGIFSVPSYLFDRNTVYSPSDYVPTADDLDQLLALVKGQGAAP